MAHSIPKRHPELVSGSVRGEEQERLAESMTIQGAKSQKPTAKVKNMFFCSSVEKRKRKPKASDEKRSGIIRETLSLKLQGCWGEAKTFPVQKQNAFFDLLLQK